MISQKFLSRIGSYMFLIILMVAVGCAPVYIPSARHTHQLDKKGEASASGYTGINGADVQLAYAVSENIGLLAAGSFGKNSEEDSEDYHKHTYGELGLQYHKGFGIGRFALMAGLGTGSSTTVYDYDFSNSQNAIQATGKYNKFFVQPNIGLETDVLDAGVAFRLGHVAFNEFETTADRYSQDEQALFFEPGLFARLGWKNVKFEGQIGYTVAMDEDHLVGFDYQPFFITLGLHLNINTLRD